MDVACVLVHIWQRAKAAATRGVQAPNVMVYHVLFRVATMQLEWDKKVKKAVVLHAMAQFASSMHAVPFQ